MSIHNAGPYRLTIPNAGTDSPALSTLLSAGQLKVLFGSAIGLTITCVSAALTGTVSVQVVATEGGSTWTTLQQSGAPVTIGALTTVPIFTGAFRDLRIHSGSAEGANRDFDITVQIGVT